MLIDLLNAYRTDAQHLASVLLALAIWRSGAGPERWLIGVFIATMVAPLYLFRWLGLGSPSFGAYAWLWIGIDLVAAAAFITIALMANRNYPLWIAGFQLVAISAHAVRGMVDTVSPLAYLILSTGPSYCQLLLIFVGYVRHTRRVRRFGAYRDWRIARDRTLPFHA
jgi:hypothetical protein